jgi:hypothetical protein
MKMNKFHCGEKVNFLIVIEFILIFLSLCKLMCNIDIKKGHNNHIIVLFFYD